jgi:hypothetical protein
MICLENRNPQVKRDRPWPRPANPRSKVANAAPASRSAGFIGWRRPIVAEGAVGDRPTFPSVLAGQSGGLNAAAAARAAHEFARDRHLVKSGLLTPAVSRTRSGDPTSVDSQRPPGVCDERSCATRLGLRTAGDWSVEATGALGAGGARVRDAVAHAATAVSGGGPGSGGRPGSGASGSLRRSSLTSPIRPAVPRFLWGKLLKDKERWGRKSV